FSPQVDIYFPVRYPLLSTSIVAVRCLTNRATKSSMTFLIFCHFHMIHNVNNGHLTATSEVDINGYLTGEYISTSGGKKKKEKKKHKKQKKNFLM
ncbi:hypothetical protein C0J52_23132, partial [Blattella germanica]